ncbi:MAG: hypothetical protein GX045_00065 [Clostridiaceae bacterium]|nr:hypothetical protein [Clostridiaceae bacterium]
MKDDQSGKDLFKNAAGEFVNGMDSRQRSISFLYFREESIISSGNAANA